MNEIISKAVAVFRRLQSAQDDEVYYALVAAGIERQLAARLVEFLPLAYCRLILAATGARFSNTFCRVLKDGTFEERLLSDEPVWNAAVAFADAERERGVPGEELLIVAARSAEFQAANQLLQGGSKLENLAFARPALTRSEISFESPHEPEGTSTAQ
jgi:hypothetical protein